MAGRRWKDGLLTVPGIGIALLPKLACPFCWPLYAGIVSSLGLGFLISSAYLLPLTIAFLALTLSVLAFRAKERRGYGPFVLGVAASAAILFGKFYLDLNSVTYFGIAVLVAASAWNAWPRRVVKCGCEVLQER
jgi:hypothetical protein